MMLLAAGERGLGRLSEIANKRARAVPSEVRESRRFPPAIHSLGTESFPVDESSNERIAARDEVPIESAPILTLGSPSGLSTRLSDLALILASTSPIRRQMLEAAGVEHQPVRPRVDEDEFRPGSNDPSDLALRLAIAKALSVPGEWVVGSDSVVSVGDRLFDKPRDREQASEHLRFFSSKPMRLTSAVALACGGKIDWSYVESAILQVRPLSEEFIQGYLDAEWPEVGYCVGVFRIEGRGVQLFEQIEGDHFTILGMPLLPLLGALRERGLLPA